MLVSIKELLRILGTGPDWTAGASHAARPGAGSSSAGRGFTEFTSRAAARILATLAQEYEFVVHQPVPKDGRLLARAEVAAENQDGTLTEVRAQIRVETASGAVVGPYELQGKCGDPNCGQYESTLLRCSVCGGARCYLHCQELVVGGQKRVFCTEHLAEALRDWDAWAEYDLARGIPRPIPTKPPKPAAANLPPPTHSLDEQYPTERPQGALENAGARRADQGSWAAG